MQTSTNNKVKPSKTERKPTTGRGDHLKSQEKKKPASAMLSRHMSDRTAKDDRRKSKENDKGNEAAEKPQQAGQLEACLGCVHPLACNDSVSRRRT